MFAVVLVTGIAIVSLSIVAWVVTVRSLTSTLDGVLTQEARAYRAAVRDAKGGLELEQATRDYLTGRTGGAAGLDPVLAVTFDDGRTISNSDLQLEEAEGNPLGRGPVEISSFDEAMLEETSYRLLSVPLSVGDARQGVFQAALSLELVRDTANRVALALAAAGLLAMAFGLPLADWASRRSLAPLRQMAADAAAISHAQPGGRIEYAGPRDELGSLADSLNEMLHRLEQSYDDQRRFVADASHELRTPIAVVRGAAELVGRDSTSADERDEGVRMIEEESARLSRLVDEMLALARLESVGPRHMQPLEVRTMLEEAAARTQTLGDRDVDVSGPAGLWVMGDPDMLEQALMNIARNAVAHTAEGGEISLMCAADDSHVRMTVTDNGPGVPPEAIDRVFDRFYRAAGPRGADSGGAGLGLAIAERLVHVLGGNVGVQNVEPHGAAFTIELPRIPAPEDLSHA